MTTKRAALDALRAAGDPEKAKDMHRYHKVDRPYLGVANPVIDDLVKAWRADIDLDARLVLAGSFLITWARQPFPACSLRAKIRSPIFSAG